MAARNRRGVADATDSSAQRLNVRINPESYKRLMVHCVMAGMTPGRLVEQLISEHLKSWRVQAIRNAQATADDRLEIADSVSLGSVAAA